jgi:hypothetical protein
LASPSERLGTAESILTDSPLMGFVRLMPHHRHDRRASTPGWPLERRRPLAARITLTARSILVVSHHLDGLRRVTASGVLQPVPVRVRCVSSSTDPHCLANQSLRAREKNLSRNAGTLRRTFAVGRRQHLSVPPLPS